MKTKNILAGLLALVALWMPGLAVAEGTWTVVSNAPPGKVGLLILLSDGSVLAANSNPALNSSNWFRLSPDSHGSYTSGTWSNCASAFYTHNIFQSDVLRDGRVFVSGGENGNGGAKAEIFNPTNNTWTDVSPPASVLNPAAASPLGGNQNISDANSVLLANGNILITPVSPNTIGGSIIYNPTNNTWSNGPVLVNATWQDEASWVKLPDDSILTIDPWYGGGTGTNSERYLPALNVWTNDATVPAQLFDAFAAEIGPAFLLPNGKAFFIGSTTNTAIYTPSGNNGPGSWTLGPVMTNSIGAGLGAPDAPAAMLVNGKILCALSPTPSAAHGNPAPTYFYEYDPTNGPKGTFTQVHAPDGTFTINDDSQAQVMLDLPDGSVLMLAYYTNKLFVYKPDGSPLAIGKPNIQSVAFNADGTLHLKGTLFNGISQGASFGDDWQMDSNFPLVRFTAANGIVRYGRTYNWSSTGVMTGTNILTTECTVPSGASVNDSIQVVANGNASDPVALNYALNGITWVDFNFGGTENGTFNNPWSSLSQGNFFSPSGGLIEIKAGSSSETLRLAKPARIVSYGGTARIGP
jgi:hypothetical protein